MTARETGGFAPFRRLRAAARRVFGLGETDDYDAERTQGIIRVVLLLVFDAYTIPVALASGQPAPAVALYCAHALLYIPVSWLFLLIIRRWPGHYVSRRLFFMANDTALMTFAMALGGAPALPVYLFLLWAVVGHGLRFGPNYLAAAAGATLISLLITTLLNDYWQANPYLAATLMMTTLVAPSYAYVLLKRVRGAYDAALEANLAKSRFLAQASHDLRQPIHAISLFTACLRDAGLGREERQMVENIDRSLQSVSRLFRSLLDISTLDSGRVTPRLEPVAIGALIDDVVRQNSEAAQWAGVAIQAVPTGLHVQTDPALFATMLQNIVTNALKYAAGRPMLIGCRRRGGRLAVEVYDRGDGIAAEHLPKVFDEFYQVRERGDKDVEGVGLGLSIVRRLSLLMGLTVSLRSVEGRGTAVVIGGLRIVAPPPLAERRAAARPASAMDGLTVLLVEDDEDVLDATAALLEKWGCVVHAGTAPPERNVPCDILITDFDLGARTTGTDCIERVRRLAGRRVPAIVTTGHDENRVREDLGDPEIPILSKPVRPAELRSVMMAERLKAQTAASGPQPTGRAPVSRP